MGRHPCYRTGTRDATALAPTTEMGPCHRNPATCKIMSQDGLGHRAVVRLLYSFNSLLDKLASSLPRQKSRSWIRKVRPGCGSPH